MEKEERQMQRDIADDTPSIRQTYIISIGSNKMPDPALISPFGCDVTRSEQNTITHWNILCHTCNPHLLNFTREFGKDFCSSIRSQLSMRNNWHNFLPINIGNVCFISHFINQGTTRAESIIFRMRFSNDNCRITAHEMFAVLFSRLP